VRRLLNWFRVTDDDGRLSLTHAGVVVGLVVYVLHPDATTAAFATACLANYGVFKKIVPARLKAAAASADIGAITDTLKAHTEQLSAIRSGATWASTVGKRG
jgi:hypothetical protein